MPLLFSLFILLAEFAALALVQFATEALLYQIVQTVAQRLQFHVVDDLVDEGVLQQQAGFLEGDASLRNGMPAELIPCRREEADLVVLTSDGAPDGPEGWADTPLVLVPKTWCLGMGCRRGKTAAELMAFLEARVAPRDVLRDRVFAIASIDRKADEQGLIDLAALLGVPFLTFSAETLKEMQGDFAGSAFVSRTVGVDNVCERAAAAAADGGELIIRKTAGDGITAAVARRTVRSLRWTDYRN